MDDGGAGSSGGTSASTGGSGGSGGSGGAAAGASGTGTGGGGGMSGTGGTGSTDASGTGGASGTGAGGSGGMGAGDSGTDAGTGTCPTGLEGPLLVNVPAPAGSTVSSYCMDATEVTNAQYATFLADSPSTSGQDTWCSFNTTYTPSSGWPATGKDAYPVAYVDWCDAYAYCKWAGKRLCGKIGGGANAPADYSDATKSEWFNACSAGGSVTYPYGDTYAGTACNGSDNDGVAGYQSGSDVTGAVGAATCEGGYAGLYDLSGNVLEWEDSCDGTTGSMDACHQRGGSYASPSSSLRCDYDSVGTARDAAGAGLGFRCCSASL